MSIFPWIQSILATDSSTNGRAVDAALQAQMEWYAAHAFNDSGYLYNRWDMGGQEQNATRTPKDASSWFGCLVDQVPHYILAHYHQAVNTGNAAFLRQQMSSLDAASDFLLESLRMREEGVPIVACSTGRVGTRPTNWLDAIAFGHHDGLVAALSVQSMGALAEMKAWLGDTGGAAKLSSVHVKAKAEYNRVYWNDTLGAYSDWIDVDGKRRSYFFTWHNLIAITAGIASDEQARSILQKLDAYRASIASQFNVSLAQMFCTPSNMIPVESDDTLYCNHGAEYPYYENGDCFLLVLGWEMLARARIEDADGAWASLEALLGEYRRTRLWGQRFSWLDSRAEGDDILTGALMALVGGLQGAFGIAPSLERNIATPMPPAAKLEGSSWTFQHLGEDITITVTGGQVHFSRPAAGFTFLA